MAQSGLWSTATLATPTPLLAVLEVSGAVLSWTVDRRGEAAITFTDARRADWLWRVVGERGHSALAAALDSQTADGDASVEVADVDLPADGLGPLRRLALGHWLRRWWPASQRDGIAILDGALLDAEIAVLTAAAQDFFADDTLDSEIIDLLAPHAVALNASAALGDPRVIDLVDRCRELADEAGVVFDRHSAVRRRDDYALAAGGVGGGRTSAAVADGTSSIRWAAVPPGVFDAAEHTAAWSVVVTGDAVEADVRTELLGGGSPNGITVRLRSGPVTGEGLLAADGRATLPLTEAGGTPITETVAWNHDWRNAELTVGAEVEESAQIRDRVRVLARTRLRQPGDDAFLAEILAAESDY